jgi:spore coat protein U-like protein
MRKRLVLGAVASIAIAAPGPASAAARVALPVRASTCSTAVAFGDPQWRERSMFFRATVEIACPPGVAFSAALRSANGCELHSSGGSALRYEMFADAAMQSAIVSCERAAEPLRGTGRQTFVVYGRIAGSSAAAGRFTDAILATITL